MTLKRDRSREEFARACNTIPGGVNSPARAFGAVGGDPLIIERGQGQFLYDIDGNELLDYVGSWGPHILGHQHPDVMAAVRAALDDGTSFGAPTPLETELAEFIVASMPSIEKVRMVNSGTEATMSALRVARGFTGRNEIIKFAGCYHGHVDNLLVKAGSGALTHGVPSSPGVPPGATADTTVLEYNDVDALVALFGERGDQIAAVILEPVVGNMGVVLPHPEFLQACRDQCTRSGALLIFDEVMTGFRVAYGGAQALWNVRPDMTTLGKIIGGGMPVGAYGGRADVMDTVSPVGPVYQAGTLSGNPLAMACGLATLKTLKSLDPYAALDEATQRLTDGLSRAAADAGVPQTLARCGSMFTLFFTGRRVNDLNDAMECDTDRFARYFQEMLQRGVYLPCSQFEANFVSAAHAAADIDRTIAAAAEALNVLAGA